MATEQTQQVVTACTGDCKKCTILQRGYCASQIAYNNMQMLSGLVENISELKNKIAHLRDEVAELQSEEADLISPK